MYFELNLNYLFVLRIILGHEKKSKEIGSLGVRDFLSVTTS